MTERVSNEVRRENQRAIAQRDRWRDQYRMVTSTIRDLKSRRSTNLVSDRAVQLELEVMRSFATFMMDERFNIKLYLIGTAYKYVDKVA